jgi:hypothetical protein
MDAAVTRLSAFGGEVEFCSAKLPTQNPAWMPVRPKGGAMDGAVTRQSAAGGLVEFCSAKLPAKIPAWMPGFGQTYPLKKTGEVK